MLPPAPRAENPAREHGAIGCRPRGGRQTTQNAVARRAGFSFPSLWKFGQIANFSRLSRRPVSTVRAGSDLTVSRGSDGKLQTEKLNRHLRHTAAARGAD